MRYECRLKLVDCVSIEVYLVGIVELLTLVNVTVIIISKARFPLPEFTG